MSVHTTHEAVLEPCGEQTWLELAFPEPPVGRFMDLYGFKLHKKVIVVVFLSDEKVLLYCRCFQCHRWESMSLITLMMGMFQ